MKPSESKPSNGKINEEEYNELLSLLSNRDNFEKLKDLINTHSKKQRTMKDWYDEFDRAEKLGVFSSDVQASAQNWGCCAIGSRIQKENPELARMLAQEVGKNKIKIPLTDEAQDLGIKFYEAVECNKVQEAREIFKQIHELPRIFKTQEELSKKKEIESEPIQEVIDEKKKRKWWKL